MNIYQKILAAFLFFYFVLFIIDFYAIDYKSILIKKISYEKQFSYQIFFVESKQERIHFAYKQICAFESAAKNNPNAIVNIYTLNAKLPNNLTHVLEKYQNLKIIKFNAQDVFLSTPLESWWKEGRVLNSSSKVAHISDAMRLVLLYKNGGVYSDLDTICLKSFEDLLDFSGVGYLNEWGESLGNGFIIFKKNHSFLLDSISDFARSYDPNIWAVNGPLLIKKVLRIYCNVSNIYSSLMVSENEGEVPIKSITNQSLFQTNHKCSDIVIFPERFFYPYTWINEYGLLYEKNSSVKISLLKNTYSLHFYSAGTDGNSVKVNDDNLYEYFASINCPTVYKFIKKTKELL